MDARGLEAVAGPRPGLPRSEHACSGPCGTSPRPHTPRHALLRRSRALYPHPGWQGSHTAPLGALSTVTRLRMDTPAWPRPDKGDPVPRVRPPRWRRFEPSGRAENRRQNPGRTSHLDLALTCSLRAVGRCSGSVLYRTGHNDPRGVAVGPRRRQRVRGDLRRLVEGTPGRRVRIDTRGVRRPVRGGSDYHRGVRNG